MKPPQARRLGASSLSRGVPPKAERLRFLAHSSPIKSGYSEMRNKYLYPVTEKTIHKYAESIFTPIRRGECVTTVWAPMAGRRMWNKFIIENINLFEKELPHFQNYLLVYVEPLDLTEESLAGYLRLMAKSFIEVCEKNKKCKKELSLKEAKIFDDQNASYSSLLQALRKMLQEVTDSGLEVVFFVGEFDELDFANKVFYNNLKSLWSQLFPRLHYLFLMRERVTRQENIALWGELNEAVLQNVVHLPLLSSKDADYVIKRISDNYSLKLKDNQKKVLKKLCGGHPYLLKVCIRVLSGNSKNLKSQNDLEELLLNYYELQSVGRGILNVRSETEKKVLRSITRGKEVKEKETLEILSFLKKIGMVISGKKIKLFGKIFEDAVLDYRKGSALIDEKQGELKFDSESGAILYNDKTVEEKFTRQEYAVLRMFLQAVNQLRSRDDIGDILWGKESYEKYSDWAIDQLISKLRKKLNSLGVKDRLVTVRGKGYKFMTG